MKQILTLSPIDKGNHTIPFRGEYDDKFNRAHVYLLANGHVAVNRELTKEEKVFTYLFGDKMKFWTYEYDDNNKEEVLWAEKLKRHDLVRCDGNSNLFRPIFELVDSRKEATKKVSNNKLMLMVGNMVGDMNVSEMRDVAYFKGEDVSRMTGEQIYLKLCSIIPNQEMGILMASPEEALTSLSNPDREIITVVNKAIALDVIKSTNGMYYIGQTLVGENKTAIVAYCKSNTQIYESHVKSEVRQKDRLPIGMTEDIKVDELLGSVKTKEFKHRPATLPADQKKQVKEGAKRQDHDKEMARQAELLPLREEAKKLGVRGWQTPTIGKERLMQKIAERKEEMKSVSV